ncbi:Hypothetical_protein [Hexamita inflata]|uniref:Hypothetical_protein n=1 Tax=Hexamita inflata TaxID=28002 RepID=A0ABP1GJX4_9EUKA
MKCIHDLSYSSFEFQKQQMVFKDVFFSQFVHLISVHKLKSELESIYDFYVWNSISESTFLGVLVICLEVFFYKIKDAFKRLPVVNDFSLQLEVLDLVVLHVEILEFIVFCTIVEELLTFKLGQRSLFDGFFKRIYYFQADGVGFLGEERDLGEGSCTFIYIWFRVIQKALELLDGFVGLDRVEEERYVGGASEVVGELVNFDNNFFMRVFMSLCWRMILLTYSLERCSFFGVVGLPLICSALVVFYLISSGVLIVLGIILEHF